MIIKKIQITYCCMDCGDKICKGTAIKGGGRCGICAKLGRNNPMFGKTLEETHIENCICSWCKRKRGESHLDNCSCVYCKTKRGEMKGSNSPSYGKTLEEMHGINCFCPFCKNKRGENKKPRKIYYCIEKDCNNNVSKEGVRCVKCKKLQPTSEKTRKKISESKKGKKPNPITIEKMRKSKMGGKSGLYVDGRTPLHIMIRSSREYKYWRTSIFQRDNYTCQDCGVRGGDLEVHHCNKKFSEILNGFLTKYSKFSPIEDKYTLLKLAEDYEDFWDADNGETLCKDCHKETKKVKTKKV